MLHQDWSETGRSCIAGRARWRDAIAGAEPEPASEPAPESAPAGSGILTRAVSAGDGERRRRHTAEADASKSARLERSAARELQSIAGELAARTTVRRQERGAGCLRATSIEYCCLSRMIQSEAPWIFLLLASLLSVYPFKKLV